MVIASSNAQSETETTTTSDFNKWSIELNYGVNKPSRPFTDGYKTGTPSLYNGDLGVRYMFNNKFGIKADIGYYNIDNNRDTPEFKSRYYRSSIQGVVNMGRLLNFENWTNRLGALIHAGPGYAQFKTEGKPFTDRMGTFMIGLTGQFKISERIVFTADFSSITHSRHEFAFDGNSLNPNREGFDGGMFTGTAGLTFYLGKNKVHADWYKDSDRFKEDIEALDKRVGELETMMNDSDKDGVPDYLDMENNSIAGVAVDTKGRMVDVNRNGVPDELEKYLENSYLNKNSNTNINNNDASVVKKLINEGYVTTYFDFNKTNPTNVSTEGIDFMLTYLRNNPTATAEIIGHADEIGTNQFNERLSKARAESVKGILVKAGIEPSRLTTLSNGEDTTVDVASDGARKLVRRVTFRVK